MKVCRKAHKPRQFFMFNDGLLYAEIVTTQRYIFRKFMPVSSLKVKDVPDDGGEGEMGALQYQNAFVIRSSQKSFIVYASTRVLKQRWLSAVNQVVDTQKREKEDYEAPVWIPDDACERCLICHALFTFINRRHHCRHCGRVVCSACSPHKLFLGETYPQRVCNLCFDSGECSSIGKEGEERGEGKDEDYRKSLFSKDIFRKISMSSAELGGTKT